MNVESLIFERVAIALSRLDLTPSYRTLLLSVSEEHLRAQYKHYCNCPPPVELPILCCEANGASPKRAIGVASAWFLLQVAAHLLDKVEDHELEMVNESKLGPAVSMNLSTGLIFVAEWILNHLELDCVDAGAAWDIHRAFQETVLSVCSGQHLDLSVELPDLSTCWQIAEAKSGSAYSLACYVGTRTATHLSDRLACMDNFGRHLGTIVQISDDIADMERDRSKHHQSQLSPFANAYLTHLGILGGLRAKDHLERDASTVIFENSLVLYLRLEALKYAELAKKELKQLALAAEPRDQILAILQHHAFLGANLN
jgi:geranylgeranyl pyrophosphate synthase